MSGTHRAPQDDGAEMGAASKQVGRSLRGFGEARRRDGLEADDVLILLALGHLGLKRPGEPAAGAPRPASCAEISKLLGIPKETVRRRAARLAALGDVEVNGRGVKLRDLTRWRALGALLGYGVQNQTVAPK